MLDNNVTLKLLGIDIGHAEGWDAMDTADYFFYGPVLEQKYKEKLEAVSVDAIDGIDVDYITGDIVFYFEDKIVYETKLITFLA